MLEHKVERSPTAISKRNETTTNFALHFLLGSTLYLYEAWKLFFQCRSKSIVAFSRPFRFSCHCQLMQVLQISAKKLIAEKSRSINVINDINVFFENKNQITRIFLEIFGISIE